MKRRDMKLLLEERFERIALLETRIDTMDQLVEGYRAREQAIFDTLSAAKENAAKMLEQAPLWSVVRLNHQSLLTLQIWAGERLGLALPGATGALAGLYSLARSRYGKVSALIALAFYGSVVLLMRRLASVLLRPLAARLVKALSGTALILLGGRLLLARAPA